MYLKKDIVAAVFDEYNEKLSEAYNEFLLSEYYAQSANKDREKELIDSVEKSMLEWAHQYRGKQFDGLSLYAFFKSLEDAVVAFDYILHAAYICDDGIPPILISLLRKNEKEVLSPLFEYILNVDWQNDAGDEAAPRDDVIAVASLINLLEHWGCENVYEHLVLKYVSTKSPFNIISDAIMSYLSSLSINDCLVQYLIGNINSMLDQSYNLSNSGEVLLVSLTAISSGHENKSSYLCVQECFLRMDNKIIAAICFGDLRDKRAVEFLRNWLIDNQNMQLDKMLITEIISSIKRLGGKTSDMESIYA